MVIKPIELIEEPLELHEQIAEGTVDYAPDTRQVGLLSVEGRAELIEEIRGPKEVVQDIRLRADYKGDFEVLCARCVDPVPTAVEGDFDLLFRPAGTDASGGERSISEAETEIGYYEESGLVLEDVVREQVLLSLPGRTLCKPDCKGLCPRCGQNLNQETCDCGNAPADPRWSALGDLAARMKS